MIRYLKLLSNVPGGLAQTILTWLALIVSIIVVIVIAWKVSDYIIEKDGGVREHFVERSALFWDTKIADELFIILKLILPAVILFSTLILLDVLPVFTEIFAIGGAIIFAPLANTFIIYRYRLAKKGDMIEDLEDGTRGTVVDISLLYTTLITFNYEKFRIPNYRIRSDGIVNYMRQSRLRRINLEILVTYDSDIDKVRNAVLNVISKSDSTLEPSEMDYSEFESSTTLNSEEPKLSVDHRGTKISLSPKCKIEKLESSGILFRAYFWIKEPCRLRHVKSELREDIVRQFNNNEIEIAYPHKEILLNNSSNAIEVEFGLFD